MCDALKCAMTRFGKGVQNGTSKTQKKICGNGVETVQVVLLVFKKTTVSSNIMTKLN